MKSNPLKDAALHYAELKFRVMPLHDVVAGYCSCKEGKNCRTPGKHPRITDWVNKASNDPKQIHSWWARWRNANVGIVCGEVIVFDVDPRHGGMESWGKLQERFGADLFDTVTAQTGGGGVHLVFQKNGREIGNDNNGLLGAGIDVKGVGGLFVAAPSLHSSGQRYAWKVGCSLDEKPLALFPTCLADLLNTEKKRSKEPVTEEIQKFTKGQRHKFLLSCAGSLRKKGLGKAAILATLKALNQEQCDPPKPDKDLEKLAADICKKPPGKTIIVDEKIEEEQQAKAAAKAIRNHHPPDNHSNPDENDEEISEEAKEILPAPTLKSVVRVLTTNPQFKNIIFYDEFLGRPMTGEREWADTDDLELTIKLQGVPGLQRIGIEIVRHGAMTVAFRNKRNCVKDWLESLTWDDVPRIEHFFEDHFSADSNSYTRAASKNFWISMVARAFKPGCQVDHMPVLEGAQGIRKSTALRVIGGDWFTEQHESVTGRGFFEVLQGKLLVEISEMQSFSRAEVTKVKQVVTCVSDRFRVPWGRHAQDHPRQCVFVGTTNHDDWNRDVTGARRFWPIACKGDINVEAIRAVRSQCFAEAVTLYKAGAIWWEMPSEETKNEQEARYTPPAWAEPIQRYIDHERVGESTNWRIRVEPLTDMSVAEILKNALAVPEAQWNKSNEMQVAEALRWLGWKKDQVWSEGKNRKRWRPILAT